MIEIFFRLQQIFLIFSQTLRVRGSDLDWNRRLPDSACTAAVFRILEEKIRGVRYYPLRIDSVHIYIRL